MIFQTVFLFAASLFQIATSTELCKEKEWFNDLSGDCETCKVCPEKSWEMSPCLEFSNTMCVHLIEIGREIGRSLDQREAMRKAAAGSDPKVHHKWHEMEGNDNARVHRTESKFDEYENMWGQVICIVLSFAFMSLSVIVIVATARYCRRVYNPYEHHDSGNRSRLFSRDRLNTTEYMNNLATLDRRLAIDEILEKRKKAIFEPQLLNENIYTDEVFVDISGLPGSLLHHHHQENEESDHKKCLLQMKDHNENCA